MADQNDDQRQNAGADAGADGGFKPFTEADVDAAFVAGDMDKLKEIAAWGAKTTPGLYKRAKEAEGELKKRPPADDAGANNANERKPDQNAAKRPQDHPDYQDLRFDGYNLEETEFIIKNGGRAALNDPYVKQAIESKREEIAKQKRTEEGTPSQDGRSPIYKKYTEEELRAMPLKDLEAILPKGPQS